MIGLNMLELATLGVASFSKGVPDDPDFGYFCPAWARRWKGLQLHALIGAVACDLSNHFDALGYKWWTRNPGVSNFLRVKGTS